MTADTVVGILHPGEMGSAFAAQIRQNGHTVLWCPAGRSPASTRRATTADLSPVDLTELAARAQVVLSICPPEFADDVAANVINAGFTGIFVEANAINPNRVIHIAEHMTTAGAVCCDGSIIGPPPRGDRTTRLYLAGPPNAVEQVGALFAETAVQPIILGERAGAASGLKMAYAGFQKVTRALAAVSYALADHHDVTEHLLAEANRNPKSPLTEPDYLPSVAARAWRWAPELRDVADTLTNAGLPPELALAGAHTLDHWHDDKDTTLPLPDVLNHLRTHPPNDSPNP